MKKISKKIVVSVTAAAFLSLAGVGVWAYAAPYSYVSLDVNPSIEYTLNMFDRVIDVEAVNDDGQAILEDAGELKNLTIEDAITKTVDELVEEGYLQATTSVTDVTETVSGSAIGTDDSAEAQQDGASTTTVSEGAATETGTTVEATNETGTTTETVTGSAVDTTTTTGTDATAGTTDTTTTDTTTTDTTTTDTTTTDTTTTDTTTTDTTTTTDNNSDDIVVGGIVITVSNKDGELTDDLVDKIRDAVEDIISQEVEVEVMGVGYARVQEARKLGVTPGKLNLVEKLKASSSDPDSIVISEWVNKPVKEIMQATKENKKAQIFSTAIQPEETSEAANDDTAAGTVSESTAAVNTDDTNTAEDVNQNAVITENEDADAQGEDLNDDADDGKEIRKEAYKAVKKAEKDAKKEAMEATKEDNKTSREESREAKKKADEAAKEAKKLAKETAKEANEQIVEAAEEEREATEKVREASEEDREDADDEDGNGGKDNYGSIKSAEKRNNQNGKGKR